VRGITARPLGAWRWALLALAISLGGVPPATAQATPPTLVAVARQGGQITANWVLPPGMAMDFIEAASSPAVTPDAGDFPLATTVLAESLSDFQTSYASSVQISEGTYYVHASAFDTTKCISGDEPNCKDEWSNILTVSVPPGVDKSTDFSFLDARTPQRIGKLYIEGSMGEPGTITAAGTVSVSNASKVYKFKTVSAKALPGVRQKLRLVLPKKALKVVRKALKRHRKLKAKVTATAKDNSGNTRREKGTIRLKL
jgi:hypothetical protein